MGNLCHELDFVGIHDFCVEELVVVLHAVPEVKAVLPQLSIKNSVTSCIQFGHSSVCIINRNSYWLLPACCWSDVTYSYLVADVVEVFAEDVAWSFLYDVPYSYLVADVVEVFAQDATGSFLHAQRLQQSLHAPAASELRQVAIQRWRATTRSQ